MNFTFLVILSLLTLGFTYETLKITHKQVALIVIVLVILLVSYILGNLNDYNSILFELYGDLNSDDTVNVSDILELVNIILNNN